MRGELTRKLGIVAIMSTIAIVTGPFDTFETMSAGARVVYWPLVIAGIAVVMVPSVYLAVGAQLLSGLHMTLRITLGALLAALPGTMILLALDRVFFDQAITLTQVAYHYPFVAGIGIAVGIVEHYLRPKRMAQLVAELSLADESGSVAVSRPQDQEAAAVEEPPERPVMAPAPMSAPIPDPAAPATPEPERPRFLSQFDLPDRARLLAISTDDHYVVIHTDQGDLRHLMRLSDAAAQLEGFPGMRVHRSHWVAFAAVEDVIREGRKLSLRLSSGQEVPVSRANAPEVLEALRAQGLVPA